MEYLSCHKTYKLKIMKTTITTIILALSISLRAQTCAISLMPQYQGITCALSSVQNITVSVSPANPIHTFISPMGGIVTFTSNPVIYQPIGTGTYTYILTDAVTGCTNSSQFSVSSASVFPSFSISSSQAFILGCAPKDVDIVSITNVTTTGAPSYTMLPPGSSSVLPNGSLGIQTGYNINSTGTWTAVVRDNNGCQTRVAFTVGVDSVHPVINLSPYTKTLTCSTSSIILNVSNTNCSYIWDCGTSTVFTHSTVVTSPASYTLTIEDNGNACKSSTVFPIYQNIASPTLNISSSYTLECGTNSLLITPLNPNLGYNYSWNGSINTASTSVTSPGTYSLQVINPLNGCETTSVVSVEDCNLVGIKEYSMNVNQPIIYREFPSGRVIEKRYNEVIIEQVGEQKGHLIRFEQK